MLSRSQRHHGQVAAGEGVGLALVRRIVERHRGHIWFESVEGQGSTFVELPPGPPPGRCRRSRDGRRRSAAPVTKGEYLVAETADHHHLSRTTTATQRSSSATSVVPGSTTPSSACATARRSTTSSRDGRDTGTLDGLRAAPGHQHAPDRRHQRAAPPEGGRTHQPDPDDHADDDGRPARSSRCYELGCNVYITKPVDANRSSKRSPPRLLPADP